MGSGNQYRHEDAIAQPARRSVVGIVWGVARKPTQPGYARAVRAKAGIRRPRARRPAVARRATTPHDFQALGACTMARVPAPPPAIARGLAGHYNGQRAD